ncbi:signal peptidase I [Streptomyces sp. E11-3]|uniref:signal peptidase I n=1 Tax=Streptomyces sp. E11-3 TaxID=3110112 RepID=UPI0039816124
MDSEAQYTERDRSPEPADSAGDGEGSRSVRVSRYLSCRVSRRGPWLSWRAAATVGATCVVFLLLFSFVVQPFLIPSSSMEPTLWAGDRVLVNKLAYRFGSEPQRGDVVVFDGTDAFGDSDYIKRVVGVGGDRVVCCGKEGSLKVNGEPVDEREYLYPRDEPSSVPFDVVVPKGTLFVLGDHRAASSDSRDRLGKPGGGMVPVDTVIGRADWIGWPFDRWTSLDRPRSFERVPAPDGAHG